MRAGRLRHKVTIQTSTLANADDYGEQTQTWSDLSRHVPAEVLNLSGVELWKARQSQPEATTQITLRYRTDVNVRCRFIYSDRYLYPLSINTDDRNTSLTLLCREKI